MAGQRLLCVAVVGLMIGACSTEIRTTTGVPGERVDVVQTTPTSTSKVVSAPGMQLAMPNTATFTTDADPSVAIHMVTDIFKEMNFSGQGEAGGDMNFPPLPQMEDRFFARARVVTADGHWIKVECKWFSENETDVQVSSDLPASEHDFVVRRIRDVLAPKPAAGQ